MGGIARSTGGGGAGGRQKCEGGTGLSAWYTHELCCVCVAGSRSGAGGGRDSWPQDMTELLGAPASAAAVGGASAAGGAMQASGWQQQQQQRQQQQQQQQFPERRVRVAPLVALLGWLHLTHTCAWALPMSTCTWILVVLVTPLRSARWQHGGGTFTHRHQGHTHARTDTHTPPPHTHPHTHAHAHAHTHRHTYLHTHAGCTCRPQVRWRPVAGE